jgi:hypothetical protein
MQRRLMFSMCAVCAQRLECHQQQIHLDSSSYMAQPYAQNSLAACAVLQVTEAAEQVASSLRQQQAAAGAAAQAAIDRLKPPAGAPARRSSRAAAQSAAHKLAAAVDSGEGLHLIVLLQLSVDVVRVSVVC